MVVDNKGTPPGERNQTQDCPFGMSSLCGPQLSEKNRASFVYTPKITNWNRALFAIHDSNAECAELERKLHRSRQIQQEAMRPRPGSAVRPRPCLGVRRGAVERGAQPREPENLSGSRVSSECTRRVGEHLACTRRGRRDEGERPG